MPAPILTSSVSTINIIPVFTCGPILDLFLLTALLFTFSCCVYYISVPPSFDSRPTNQTVIEGTNTTFHCTATGNPTPTITWMKDGKSVAEGHTLSFETSRNDSGKYWCLATNGLGESINTTVNLDVQCKLVKNLRKVFPQRNIITVLMRFVEKIMISAT